MNWLNRKKNAVLSIDISTAAVKLLELSRQGNRYRVESFAVAPLPRGVVIDKNITDANVMSGIIKVALNQSGSKLKHAAVAVAGSAVMTRVISMDATLTEDEIEEQIMIEADQYVPYPIEEVNFDFEVQQVNETNPEMVDVLLVVARREDVDNRVEALSQAGLTAKIVDIETFAMENAYTLLSGQFSDSLEGQTVAIADIGATLTTLNVLHNGRSVYIREQEFGGKQLSEEIQRRYGLSYEEAGLAKKHGGLPDNYASDVLEPFKRAMVQQIQRSLQFFASSSANRAIDRVFLAGGCASIQGVDQLVEKNLGVPVHIANPFVNMTLSPNVKPQSLSNDAAAMMIACGLALRSFD
jgi:type IV pilus assembly protein PilM